MPMQKEIRTNEWVVKERPKIKERRKYFINEEEQAIKVRIRKYDLIQALMKSKLVLD